MRFLSTLLFFIGLAVAMPAHSETTVVTWNINGVMQSPADLAANSAEMADDIRSRAGEIDVLILQEIISEDQVAAIADALDLNHWAMSDFSPPDRGFGSLEVAVLSRAPIVAASEWDPREDEYLPRSSMSAVSTRGLRFDIDYQDQTPSRGFLKVDLANDWTIYAVHWKSSSGDSCNAADIGHAMQREDQALALHLDAAAATAKGRTVVFAGDFNIQAPGTVPRSGSDPSTDCAPSNGDCSRCGEAQTDGYDDSLSILADGLPNYRLLSAALGRTYVGPGPYPDRAIDHLAVVGSQADTFMMGNKVASEEGEYQGSDHVPVYAVSTISAFEEKSR